MKKLKHHKKPPPRRKKSNKKIYQKYLTIIVMVLITILFALAVSAYFYMEDKKIVINIQDQKTSKIKEKKEITYEEKTKALEIEYVNNTDNNIYIQEQNNIKKDDPKFHYEEPGYGSVDEVKQEELPKVVTPDTKKDEEPVVIIPKEDTKEKPVVITSNKPKLVIIIDDVTTKYQINKIQDIGYPVNISFLPPTSRHKNSSLIANSLDNYMIHLPLQASNTRFEEEDTLHIEDSIEKIDKKIASLRALYPKAKFINNHTGSKFTQNQEAMDKLLQSIKKHNYHFVDSRTTAKSVAKHSAKKYGVKMFSRNIFLDNKKDAKYIQGQLKKAIKLAKKNGSAIAIGHPFNITFETLKDSKYLLEDLELIYIEQL